MITALAFCYNLTEQKREILRQEFDENFYENVAPTDSLKWCSKLKVMTIRRFFGDNTAGGTDACAYDEV